jgi:CRISPR-associated protein Csx10
VSKILYCEIQNQSRLLLGSGGGVGAIIDIDIETDDLGFPKFSARRLKGLLFESAIEVAEITNLFSYDQIKELFGKTGGDDAKILFHDFFIKEYNQNREWLKYFKANHRSLLPLSKEHLINSYCTMVSRTTINEKGIAKNNSLRKLRVIERKISFRGEVEILGNDPDRIFEKMVVLAMKNLKNVGTQRNRGLGHISMIAFKDKDYDEKYPSAKEIFDETDTH